MPRMQAAADVCDESAVKQALAEVEEKLGGHIEVRLSNVGYAEVGEFETLGIER